MDIITFIFSKDCHDAELFGKIVYQSASGKRMPKHKEVP